MALTHLPEPQFDDETQRTLFDIRQLEIMGLIEQLPGTGAWMITPAGYAALTALDDDQPEEHTYYLTPKGRETASRLLDNS